MSNTNLCYLDANVLVYFIEVSSPFHNQSINLIKRLVKEDFESYVSPLGLDEFIYAALRYLRKIKAKNLNQELKRYLPYTELGNY